jgi:hypothetical protein
MNPMRRRITVAVAAVAVALGVGAAPAMATDWQQCGTTTVRTPAGRMGLRVQTWGASCSGKMEMARRAARGLFPDRVGRWRFAGGGWNPWHSQFSATYHRSWRQVFITAHRADF